jgi:2,5-furandicarboxylate decarboxylase 1
MTTYVFDPTEVEWAIATRVGRPRRRGSSPARGKPLDPSLAPTPRVVPTTAKVGIDATIGEGIPRERYERISYAYADRARIADYLAGKTDPAQPAGAQAAVELARKIFGLIDKTPLYYPEPAEKFSDYDFQTVARALGSLHAEQKLWQDAKGRFCVRGSVFAAKP